MIARRRLLLAGGAGFVAGAAAGMARGAAASRRIVSVGGAITETVFALGEGARLVAADSTSRYPAAAARLPRIGYLRALPTEGILALRPDLVLLSSEAGPAEAIAVLRAAGVSLAVIEDGAGPGSPAAKARATAAALGRDGEALARALEEDWSALEAPIAAVRRRPRVLFVLSVARGAPLVSGRDTHADAMITAAGGQNPVRAFAGYRPLSAEVAAALAPDIILMMEHALAEAGGARAVLSVPALAVTPAARSGSVLAMDGAYLLHFGPRAAAARRDLAALLHPDLRLPELPERPWTAA